MASRQIAGGAALETFERRIGAMPTQLKRAAFSSDNGRRVKCGLTIQRPGHADPRPARKDRLLRIRHDGMDYSQ